MSALHMIQLTVKTRALMELGHERGLPLRNVDLGYLAHCYLGELFGEAAPSPFFLEEQRGSEITILGYGERSSEELRELADSFGSPLLHSGCDWDRLGSKRLPQSWEAGQRLAFDVRVCPVVRKSSAGPKHRKGAEVDVFLDRCWAAGDGVAVDRQAVYSQWLAAQFERHGGASLVSARLGAFKRERLLRRTQGQERKVAVRERPNALLRGVLEVSDGRAFQDLLRRGVGRHRAFGFGMLLLRRAEPSC